MYNKLREKIPPNEQGVIITFQKIPNRIQKELDKNNTIQIIDEEGVRTWVSITANIPARVNSISKITFDPLSKLENKIVKIDSMFYETGMAIVSVLPEMNEETVLARTLEEIELPEADASTFNDFSRNYLEFLGIIHEISNESDIFSAFFKNKFQVIDRPTEASCKIKFENHEVNIQLNRPQLSDVLQCTCFKWIEDRSHLCEHLIASLDWIARNSKYFHPTLNDRYIAIEHALEVFLAENISADLDNLLYEIKLDEDKSLLGDFVSKILKS